MWHGGQAFWLSPLPPNAGLPTPCSSMVFNVVPTAFEVALVAGILAYKCGPAFAGLTAGTIVAYTAFTFSITQASWGVVGMGVVCLCRAAHSVSALHQLRSAQLSLFQSLRRAWGWGWALIGQFSVSSSEPTAHLVVLILRQLPSSFY